MDRKHYIILVVLLLIAVGMMWLVKSKKKASGSDELNSDSDYLLRPNTHSAALSLFNDLLYVQVSVCKQNVYCVFDTGSDDVLVNTNYCVPVGATIQKGYASEKINTQPALRALGIKVGHEYEFSQVNDVQFSKNEGNDEDSILGMSRASKLKPFAWGVQYDGKHGGYFTLNPVLPSNSLAICDLVTLNNWYVIKVTLKFDDDRVLSDVLAILDTGSTACFVDDELVRAGVGFTVYTSKGDIKLKSIAARDVAKTEGGDEFVRLLKHNRALILGLPFFVGKNIVFNNNVVKTVTINNLQIIKQTST